jgi:hypothetical protein
MIPNQWYAVLESYEVKPGKPVGVTRLGEKMFFWVKSYLVCEAGKFTWVYNQVDDGTAARRASELPEPARPPFLRFNFPNLWMNRINGDMRIVVSFVPIDESSTRRYLRLLPALCAADRPARPGEPDHLAQQHDHPAPGPVGGGDPTTGMVGCQNGREAHSAGPSDHPLPAAAARTD